MKIREKSVLKYIFILFLMIVSINNSWSQSNGYHSYSDLETKLKQLADDYSKVVKLDSHGETLGGKGNPIYNTWLRGYRF